MIHCLVFFTETVICVAVHFIKVTVLPDPLDDVQRYICAMRGDPLEAVDQIEQIHTALDRTDALLQPLHMPGLDQFLQLVNRLGQGLNTDGQRFFVILECLEAGLHGVFHSTNDGIHLTVSVG